jgi:hypothetical protein
VLNKAATDSNFVARAHIARGMSTAELNGWLHRIGQPEPGELRVIRRQVLDELHGRALEAYAFARS